jgi:hypothetical protein
MLMGKEDENFDSKSVSLHSNNGVVNLTLVKEHWMFMGKDKVQSTVMQNMFFNMFLEHACARLMLAFARTISTKDPNSQGELGVNHQFR